MLTLLWLSRDLRLTDNPALQAAMARGAAVLPVYILDESEAVPWAPGAASRWWLHGSLEALTRSLQAVGSNLVLRRGPVARVLHELVRETGADAVYWNHRYEPWARTRARDLADQLQRAGVAVAQFNAGLLCEPQALATRNGNPYRVFTPFWKALQARGLPAPPCAPPLRIAAPAHAIAGDTLESWALRPTSPDWAGGLREAWLPGEASALARLAAFQRQALAEYDVARNLPGIDGTSRLSPHLHFGEIGPRQVWHAIAAPAGPGRADLAPAAQSYLAEIAWREFSYHLLAHFESLAQTPLRAEFAQFPWDEDPAALAAWQQGRTGYPIVDAGMRELWHTGWMHNRVRMIAASFLVKDLLLHWHHGAAWFWDTLVDADLASNSASWQWVAGCGADAAPYFRVFNPVLQGRRFDPHGHYVRRWVPELAALPNALLHAPWEAAPKVLAAAGITLGGDYPAPLVDHAAARQRALRAYEEIRRS